MKNIELGLRWSILLVAVVFLLEELVRVYWYVISQWGFIHAIVDGAVLHKVGEVAIIIPFLIFVHWSGVWEIPRLEEFVRKARWVIWIGGALNLIAVFDLFGRVAWAWWTILLVVFSIFSPFILKRWIRKKAKWSGRVLATILIILFMCHYAISFLTSGYCVAPLPASHPSPAESEHGRWQQDLHYLATELPGLHLNAFHTIDKKLFDNQVARLDSAIPNLNEDEIEVGFQQLVAMIGDDHTEFVPGFSFATSKVPLKLYWLSDGLFVIGAGEACDQALGARVVSIGSLTVDSAFDAVCTLIPSDCPSWQIHRSAKLLVETGKLRGLGIIENTDSVRFVLETEDGDTIVCDLSRESRKGNRKFRQLPEELPLFRTHSSTEFWSEYFKDISALYLKYNSFINPISFPRFSDKFWQMVEDSSVGYVIVDFRGNGGGLSSCFDSFFESILDHTNINRKNHLYVLVDRGTFSSASMYAATMRRETKAILVGEEMGGCLNGYGDVRSFKLPNSGAKIRYSVKYVEDWPDSLPPFKIDIPITPSSVEYFAGKDPVLDSITKLIEADIGDN